MRAPVRHLPTTNHPHQPPGNTGRVVCHIEGNAPQVALPLFAVHFFSLKFKALRLHSVASYLLLVTLVPLTLFEV